MALEDASVGSAIALGGKLPDGKAANILLAQGRQNAAARRAAAVQKAKDDKLAAETQKLMDSKLHPEGLLPVYQGGAEIRAGEMAQGALDVYAAQGASGVRAYWNSPAVQEGLQQMANDKANSDLQKAHLVEYNAGKYARTKEGDAYAKHLTTYAPDEAAREKDFGQYAMKADGTFVHDNYYKTDDIDKHFEKRLTPEGRMFLKRERIDDGKDANGNIQILYKNIYQPTPAWAEEHKKKIEETPTFFPLRYSQQREAFVKEMPETAQYVTFNQMPVDLQQKVANRIIEKEFDVNGNSFDKDNAFSNARSSYSFKNVLNNEGAKQASRMTSLKNYDLDYVSDSQEALDKNMQELYRSGKNEKGETALIPYYKGKIRAKGALVVDDAKVAPAVQGIWNTDMNMPMSAADVKPTAFAPLVIYPNGATSSNPRSGGKQHAFDISGKPMADYGIEQFVINPNLKLSVTRNGKTLVTRPKYSFTMSGTTEIEMIDENKKTFKQLQNVILPGSASIGLMLANLPGGKGDINTAYGQAVMRKVNAMVKEGDDFLNHPPLGSDGKPIHGQEALDYWNKMTDRHAEFIMSLAPNTGEANIEGQLVPSAPAAAKNAESTFINAPDSTRRKPSENKASVNRTDIIPAKANKNNAKTYQTAQDAKKGAVQDKRTEEEKQADKIKTRKNIGSRYGN
jgi:hypothetical protein